MEDRQNLNEGAGKRKRKNIPGRRARAREDSGLQPWRVNNTAENRIKERENC